MRAAAPGGPPGAAVDGAAMSLVLNPVWWDQGRSGPAAMGALIATDRLLSYVTNEETVFTLARADIRASWRPLRVDLTCAGRRFRLRFLPPGALLRPTGVLQARRKSRALRSWLAATGERPAA